MKRWVGAAGLLLLAVTIAAHAHVTVWPRESRAGAYEKYTVRVPTEGDVATVSVELQIPDGVEVVSMAAPAGYSYELNKAAGRVTRILWTTRINPGEFAEFAFLARNPEGAGIHLESRAVFRGWHEDGMDRAKGRQAPCIRYERRERAGCAPSLSVSAHRRSSSIARGGPAGFT